MSPVSALATHSPSAYSTSSTSATGRHAFGHLGLGPDVDAHSGEPGGEPGVLTLATDRQAELMIGHDDVGLGAVVADVDLVHLGGRQRLGDEVGKVLAERDDVDLLAAQLVDDHAHTGAAGADAGADRIDVVIVRPDRDLRAVTGLAGARLDLDDAVGDLRHLELEQALDEARVGATHDDLGALGGLADLDDVRLRTVARLRPLERHLLGLRQQRLDAAEVEQRVAAVGLLDDAGDDVALAVGVLLELAIALDLADALAHHLAERLGGDAPQLLTSWACRRAR